jgi:hypothetical protein
MNKQEATMKNLLCRTFCFVCFSILLGGCGRLDEPFNPEEFYKVEIDPYQGEFVCKSDEWGNWSIKKLSLDGHDLDFFTNPANAKEMELNGMTLKIEYEYEDMDVGIYRSPCKISGDYFEIVKNSEYKLIINMNVNLTGKKRLINIEVGDGNNFYPISITQNNF